MRKFVWKKLWKQFRLVHWSATIGCAWFTNAVAFIVCDFMHWPYIHTHWEIWVTALGFGMGSAMYWDEAKTRLPDEVVVVRTWFR